MTLFQFVILQIKLHGIGIGNGVAQRRACGEHHTSPTICALNIAHLVQQIHAFRGTFGVDTIQVFQLCPYGDIFVVVRLIHKQGVDL